MADFPTPAGTTRAPLTRLSLNPAVWTVVPDPATVYPFTDPIRTQALQPRLLVNVNVLTGVPDPIAPYNFTSLTTKWPYPATMAPAPPDPDGGGDATVYDKFQIWPRGQGIAN